MGPTIIRASSANYFNSQVTPFILLIRIKKIIRIKSDKRMRITANRKVLEKTEHYIQRAEKVI